MLVQDCFDIENGILKAFSGPDTEVQIPEGVHTVGNEVFKGMSWILKVTLPSSIKKIGAYAFKGCRQLKSINFPEGLSEIGEYAFHRCHGMEEMNFPKTVKKVGSHAFLYCDKLKKVILEGPDHFERATFSHNLSLQEISININVDDSNFADEVFEGCVRLRKITLSGETVEVGNLIDAMNSHAAYPKIIKSIAQSAYHSLQIEDGVLQTFNINLKNIELPEGIISIGKSCFFDKKGIVSIKLPESLREIRANAFLNCTSLTKITIQNNEIVLDPKAFRGCCNLEKVHLPERTFLLEDETSNELVSRIREQVMGDFYISGRILIRYLGDEEQIKIPKEVAVIGERCFFGNERIKLVTCPDGLIEIREQAFAGCVALQNVILSKQLKRIEREAFAECKKLLKCNIPDSVEYIGEYAFRRCFILPPFDPWPENAGIHPFSFYRSKQFAEKEEELRRAERNISAEEEISINVLPPYFGTRDESIVIRKITDIKRIGKYSFAACPNLEEIYIDAPDCVIDQNVFSNCPKLRKAHLRVKELGEGCFSYCRNLEEVKLSGVTALPAKSFAGCYSLRYFEAHGLIQMDAGCFDECLLLDSFDFLGIRKIGERAFERCDSLRNVKLDQVECGYHAFADCASLESVEITENTVLKSGVFIGCTQIRSVTFNSEKYEFSKFSDCLNHVENPLPGRVKEVIASIYSCYDIRDGGKLCGYSQDASKVSIPQDIEEVGQDVFRDHMCLTDIMIPKSVKLFGSHAFSQTLWLEEQRKKADLIIVNDVLVDGAMCKGNIVIPISVKRVASWSFAGNIEITELTIPSERIVIEALSFRNCLNLKKIIDWEGKAYTLNSINDLVEVGYPEPVQRIFSECINCFKLDEDGNLIESTGNITNLILPEGIRAVGDCVYKDCHLLESIELAKDTERIGKSAFENSKWLMKVTNARSVESIGALAFSGCQSLEYVELSDNLQKLGNRCFEHCSSLKEIFISAQLENIPERAFFRCKSLKKLYIPKMVKTIEAEAFAFCDELEEVRVPKGTVISEKAFAYSDKVRLEYYE